jgi:hypothetical protein
VTSITSKRPPRHRPPALVPDGRRLLVPNGQVHHDTHPIPIGNYAGEVRNC